MPPEEGGKAGYLTSHRYSYLFSNRVTNASTDEIDNTDSIILEIDTIYFRRLMVTTYQVPRV